MKKSEFIKKFSKIDTTSEDEFKSKYNSPELLWDGIKNEFPFSKIEMKGIDLEIFIQKDGKL